MTQPSPGPDDRQGMWSLSLGLTWGVQPALAATSSFPPQRAFHLLRSRVRELNRLADEGTIDEIFQERADEAMGYYRQLEEAQRLPLGSARSDSLRPLLRHTGSIQDALRRLNLIIDTLSTTISSLPAVSSMAPEIREVDADDDIRDRPSWVGRFEHSIAGARDVLQANIEKPVEQVRIENQRINMLAAKLWNKQWLDSQKEVVNPAVPVELGEFVPRNEVRVASYAEALALGGLAAESALAILDDHSHQHLLGHIAPSMLQERLNDLIRSAFPSLAMKRIYVLPGAGLAKESIIRILAALQACGVSKLQSTVKLPIPPHGEQFPSLLLYEGELYSKPEHFVSR